MIFQTKPTNKLGLHMHRVVLFFENRR